ncbi:hypothetical protein C8J56DRAFT_965057 [Mycena floridula]|nr:hypothetical protein C8J56DRAFT_965057 [Mycena floridula]
MDRSTTYLDTLCSTPLGLPTSFTIPMSLFKLLCLFNAADMKPDSLDLSILPSPRSLLGVFSFQSCHWFTTITSVIVNLIMHSFWAGSLWACRRFGNRI